jgi:hypothetical protein
MCPIESFSIVMYDFLKRRRPPQFHDHRTAEFVPLDEPEIQKVRPEPSNPNEE